MNSLVSIVVPIYNQENNLSNSIPSLLRQDYRNLEIIAVNDGSTDQSEHIIDDYRKKDKRIVKINKTNGGLVDAVITGIEASTGEYICFVDPDDVVKDDFVSTFMKNIECFDFLAMGYFENNGKRIIEHCLDTDKIFDKDDIRELKKRFLYNSNNKSFSSEIFDSRCNKCYRAERLKKITEELTKVKEVSMGEDTIFTYLFLNYAMSGKSMKSCNGYIYNTNSETSMTKNNSAITNYNKAKLAYECLKRISNEKNEDDSLAKVSYYSQIMTIISRLQKEYNDDLKHVYELVKNDALFRESSKIINNKFERFRIWMIFHRSAKEYHIFSKIKSHIIK